MQQIEEVSTRLHQQQQQQLQSSVVRSHALAPMTTEDGMNGLEAARVLPVPPAAFPPSIKKMLDRLPNGFNGTKAPLNVLGTLIRGDEEIMTTFFDNWITTKEKCNFTTREQELVILRLGVIFRSNYVWKHHVHIGLLNGISDGEVSLVRDTSRGTFLSSPSVTVRGASKVVDASDTSAIVTSASSHSKILRSHSSFSMKEKCILAVIDDVIAQNTVTTVVWDKCSVKGALSPVDVIHILCIVSQYFLFAHVNNVLHVAVESPLSNAQPL